MARRAPKHEVPTGRLRRRLAVAFALAAGITSGALAVGSYVLVREARLSDSLDRAQAEARFDLVLAARTLPANPDETAFESLLDTFEQQKRLHAVLVRGRTTTPSGGSVAGLAVPASLRAVAARGELGFERVRLRGTPELLVGGRIPGTADELYFVFPEGPIARDLAQLRSVLAAAWVVVVGLAALVGGLLARRTLEPVSRASEAARAIAEGLLETRLPVEGRDEFGRWAASFNEMADALEAKIRALSEAQARERRFTSDVAHELRTPLTALVGEASLLREQLDRLPQEARRPAELMILDVARLRRLVDDLMEISRFDAGREAVALEPVDVGSLVAGVVRARGWTDQVRVSGSSVVRSDRRRLERILSNLIGNGIEHAGGGVEVTIAPAGHGGVQIRVADNGPGIPSEHLAHLFERFYKADPSRRGTGSGLGLAIADENARLLGGRLTVTSRLGEGTTFLVTLPEVPEEPGPAVAERLPGGEPEVAPPTDAAR